MPWNYDYSEDIYDGLFISNGPGDPAMVWDAVLNLRKVWLSFYINTSELLSLLHPFSPIPFHS